MTFDFAMLIAHLAKTRELEGLRATLAAADPSGAGPSAGQPPMTPLQASIQSAAREAQQAQDNLLEAGELIDRLRRRNP
jgi:uncharacterized protein YggE